MVTRFRVELVMTTSIALRIQFWPFEIALISRGKKLKWMKKLRKDLLWKSRKALQIKEIAEFYRRQKWDLSSQSRYDHFDTAPSQPPAPTGAGG